MLALLLQAHDQVLVTCTLAQAFARLIRSRNAPALEPWLAEATSSGVPELRTFAAGIRRDQAAVRAALTYEWSQRGKSKARFIASSCSNDNRMDERDSICYDTVSLPDLLELSTEAAGDPHCAARSAGSRAAVTGGQRRSVHAQADRTVCRPLEHGLYGPPGNHGRAARQNRSRVPRGRARSGDAWHHGAHRPLVPRSASQATEFLRQALDRDVPEIAAAMRGYADLGVQHIMFQCEPYTPEARRRLTEALQLYRGMEQQ
jgi:hypothetical protein